MRMEWGVLQQTPRVSAKPVHLTKRAIVKAYEPIQPSKQGKIVDLF